MSRDTPTFLWEALMDIILVLSVYVNPILLVLIWIIKSVNYSNESFKWRAISVWISMSCAAVALSIFWYVMFKFSPGDESLLVVRTSKVFALLGLVAALVGRGKFRWVSALCSFLILPAWLMRIIFA